MRAIRVIGTSMWPVLKTDDVVIIDENQRSAVGDLVLCEIDGAWIVHRHLPEGVTKGDRFSKADPHIADVRGTVVGILPNGMRGRSRVLRAKPIMPFHRLVDWQWRLSHWQSRMTSRWLRGLARIGLICNGSLIRTSYYFSPRRLA